MLLRLDSCAEGNAMAYTFSQAISYRTVLIRCGSFCSCQSLPGCLYSTMRNLLRRILVCSYCNIPSQKGGNLSTSARHVVHFFTQHFLSSIRWSKPLGFLRTRAFLAHICSSPTPYAAALPYPMRIWDDYGSSSSTRLDP